MRCTYTGEKWKVGVKKRRTPFSSNGHQKKRGERHTCAYQRMFCSLVCLSVCLSVYLLVCLSVCFPARFFSCLFTDLFIIFFFFQARKMLSKNHVHI